MLTLLKKYRAAILGVALVGVASVMAHLYVQSQVYYPVIRLALPEGLSITAVLAETKERKACGRANDRFLTPFKQQCKDCKILTARCDRELEGLELALRQGEPLPYPTVVAREVRVAFMGPAAAAKLSCETAAATIVAGGFRSAACVPPAQQPGGTKS